MSIFEAILSFLGLCPLSANRVQKVTSDDEHNRIYERGTQFITPHMHLQGRKQKLDSKARRNIREGIACLKAVINYAPRNWAAFWVMGKGFQVLDQKEDARQAFKRAYDIQKENPDVAREYGNACLDLGDTEDALVAIRHAILLSSDDAGLWANLALALLFAGQLDEARKAVACSLKMAPEDQISRDIKNIIEDVITGSRKQPKNMKDLAIRHGSR